MRIATVLLGFQFAVLLYFGSFATAIFGAAGDNASLANQGVLGLLIFVAWILACDFTYPFPLAACIVFAITGVLLIASIFTGGSIVPLFFSVMAFVLSGLAYLGQKELTNQREEKAYLAREIRSIKQALTTVAPTSPANSSSAETARAAISTTQSTRTADKRCHHCGTMNATNSTWCSVCGYRLNN